MADLQSKEISVRKGIVFAFALGLAGYLVWVLRKELLLLYVAGLFAVVLEPLVTATNRFKIGNWRPFKGYAVLFLLLALAAAIVGFGYLALPPVIDDLQEFAREAPGRMPAFLNNVQKIPFLHNISGSSLFSQLQNIISSSAASVLLSIKDWASGLFSIAMGVILTVYFILEGRLAYRWFLSFIPVRDRDRLDDTLQRARVRMEKWLIGQGSLMLILGIASTLTFVILKVRYAYALGVLMGALNIIPVLGGAIGISLALLSAAIDSWGRMAGVGIFYLIYVWFENSLLIPRIMQNRLNLPGIAVLVSLLIGSALAGVLGAMVSVPTAVLVAVLLDEYAAQNHVP